MSTEKQIAASRANGKKSRGPVTEEGKLASSRNAQTHGLLSHSLILEGEALERFEEILAGMVAIQRPLDRVEMSFVENMAVCKWRQMRIWGIETAEHSEEIRNQVIASPEIANRDPVVRAAKAFRAICEQSHCPDLMGRYKTRFDRQYFRSLRALDARRKKGSASSEGKSVVRKEARGQKESAS